MSLPLFVCKLLSEVGEHRAHIIGVPMVIALTDRHGLIIHLARMDGALTVSVEAASNKAFTAAAVGLETAELGRLAAPGGDLYGVQNLHGGRITVFGGGLPLKAQGQVLAGIGVSGGTVEQDTMVARSIVLAWEAMDILATNFNEDFSGQYREKTNQEENRTLRHGDTLALDLVRGAFRLALCRRGSRP